METPKKRQQQTGLRLDPELLKRLKFIALDRDVSLNALLTDAIQEYLSRHYPEKDPQ